MAAILALLVLSGCKTEIADRPAVMAAQDYKVRFYFHGFENERDIVREKNYDVLLAQYADYAQRGTAHRAPSIGIDMMDINGDRRPEIMTYIDSNMACSVRGCRFVLYFQDDAEEWWPLYFQNAPMVLASQDIIIMSTSTNGFRDIAIRHGEFDYTRWVWDLDAYVPLVQDAPL